ncbi:hypothetical protein AJ80_07349 [Polytolypa hystricis UAMH7299]|uniref:TLC domain-containing protein n=1 Tax=Polytolypa hystricis (strain UAMH7299) TaxID=1447883 RepID=A0A2B7XP15_POLH7|nr:hypothetical protein AJ80_07349 [Polytolypa hystricis UAMH7299]
MLDPLGPPPQWLQDLVQPLAEKLSLHSIVPHVHEILLSFVFYQLLQSVVSPWLSTRLFPKFYPNFPARTKLNWDIHVVSLVQSSLINILALYVMFMDNERKNMTSGERVYGYLGSSGLIQGMATGYFIWDLIVSTVHIKIFGIGLWFHAISALWVFSLGFRPFVNYYGPTFILYELSSPFLNFHWFFDKVNMTGGRAQWYNGMMLLAVFFSCRLVWGTWQSVRVFLDIFGAYTQSNGAASQLEPFDINSMIFKDTGSCVDEVCSKATAEVSRFAQYNAGGIPFWLVLTYLGSNLILNSLNFYWFYKMIDTVLKRFRTPAAKDKKLEAKAEKLDAQEIVIEAAAKLEEENFFINGSADAGEPKVPIAVVSGSTTATGARRRKA